MAGMLTMFAAYAAPLNTEPPRLETLSNATSADQNIAIINSLAVRPMWLKLGHYQANTWSGGYTSSVDSDGFFLSAIGQSDPGAELNATIAALEAPVIPDNPQAHASCRYPARAAWLQTQLDLVIPSAVCVDYQQFINRWQPEQITLIFADAYLSNPASSFGHTFLRLDPAPDSTGTAQPVLLNGTIDFAAFTGDARGFNYVIGGLLGRFPGRFSVLPYYIQVNEYNFGALRDLWEYPLHLSATERTTLMAHLWELRDAEFDYYFVDENCSGQLLALLAVVKPELDLFDGIGATVIPGEMVRSLVQHNLLGQPTFRPALDAVVETAGQTLSTDEQQLAKWLTSSADNTNRLNKLQTLPPQQQARVLDVAYDLLRLQKQRGDLNDERFAQLGSPLLLARAELKIRSNMPTAATPAEQPAHDHGAARIRIGVGHDHAADHSKGHSTSNSTSHSTSQDFGVVGWRLVYHDLLDPRLASGRGNEVRAFDVSARISSENIILDALELISLRSLTPRQAMLKPWSWQLSAGMQRLHGNKLAFAEYGRGLTWAADLINDNLLFALGTVEAQANLGDDALDNGYRIGGGVQLGWLHTPDQWTTTLLELDWRTGIAGDQQDIGRIRLRHQWSFNAQFGLRFDLHSQWQEHHPRRQQDSNWHHSGQITIEWYL